MKTARRYQGPGRSQTRLKSGVLLQSKAMRPTELLAARKSVSKTSVDDDDEDDEDEVTSCPSVIASINRGLSQEQT